MSDKKTIWSVIAGILSSVFAFLGIVSCCGMPILAGVLAALGIGASQLSFFAEYKGLFIAFAIVSLIYGFYQAYFKKGKSCCASSDTKEKAKKKSVLPKVFLWIGTIITLLVLFIETPETQYQKHLNVVLRKFQILAVQDAIQKIQHVVHLLQKASNPLEDVALHNKKKFKKAAVVTDLFKHK